MSLPPEPLKPPTKTPLKKRLNHLYEARRVLLPPMGERAVPALFVAGTLAVLLMSVLLSLAWVQKGDVDYLRGSSGVTTLEDLSWTLTLPGKPAVTSTLKQLGETSVTELAGAPFELQLDLDGLLMREFMTRAGEASVVLSLPQIEYEKLEVVTSWLSRRTLARGEPALLYFDAKMTEGIEKFTVKLTVWPHNTQLRVIRSTVNMVPPFLSVQSRFQKYQDFLAGRRTGSGKQLADIGRIVLAVFAVFLFIFIDSSPECLALGMFMSLKALAVAVGQGWLPDGMFAASTMDFTKNFLLCFADIMQLYFFTQMARLWRPRPFAWIVGGVALGTLYAFGATIHPVAGGVNWPFQVWKWRNLLVGLGCLACSVPVAMICLRARLHHRTTALLVASSGVLVQIITPLIVDIPGVTESLFYKTWYNLFESHTPYMFALSTFINVSTLERRVKTLSSVAIRKEAIERELTLGKAVQDAFFQQPDLPPGLVMTFSHEAAEYVSGDILFSHWDRVSHTVTMLLCDVTGHGVQAALKASICSAMSASIWEDGQMRPGDDPALRLEIFHRRVTAYLEKTSGTAEILAMAGCEVDLETGRTRLYRANGLYPIVVSQKDGVWNATTRAHVSEEFDVLAAGDAAFIVLSSDGIIDGPRVMKNLLKHVEAEITARSQTGFVDAEILKQMVLGYAGLRETGDDKTIAVLDLRRLRPSAGLVTPSNATRHQAAAA